MKLKLLIFSITLIAFASCSEDDIFNDKLAETNTLSVQKVAPATISDYNVTPSILAKYLNVKNKNKRYSFTPLIENGDTLAYYVKYDVGWEIIAADKRLSPVITKSDKGELDTTHIDGQQISGILQYLKTLKHSNDTSVNGIWQFFEEPKAKNRIMPRGMGQGMWIPQDTTYVSYTTGRSKIVDTEWGQNYPWNQYTKIIDERNAVVGCGPVAAGQVIYFFRENNPQDCQVPASAKYVATNPLPVYSDFSTEPWGKMAKNVSFVDYPNYTAIFLGYLGKQMEVKYGLDGTSTIPIKIGFALSDYKLTYSKKDSYDFHTIYANLRSNQPVILCADTKDNIGTHAFIANGYTTESDGIKVSYIWDPEHRITEWEFDHYDESMFLQDASGNEYKEEEFILTENVYFRMNWGYAGYEDNRFYNVAYKTSSMYEVDGKINVDYNETIYSPYWICGKYQTSTGEYKDIVYNRVYKMFYDIQEATESNINTK